MEKKPYSRVYLEITNICNRACSFCHGTSREPRRMSREDFERAARALVPMTDYLYFHLMGEPTTHPELTELIKTAKGLGFKCAVTTNGTLLKDKGDALIGSGVYKVNISVHSFEGGEGREKLEYLSEIADFADKASERGVLVVLRLWNSERGEGANEGVVDFFKERLRGEWKWGARGARIRHKLHLEYGERFDWPDMGAEDGGERVFCYGLCDHFGVLCDGTVVPCCLDSDGRLALGNIFSEPIEKILNSERALAISEGFKQHTAKEELCRKCGYARRFKV